MKEQLSQDRWEQVRGLFAKVVDLRANDRAEFLTEACARDAELRAEVESLLEQDSHVTEGFLRPPDPPTAGREPLLPDSPELPPGSKVGRYEIKRVIASGGMGTVYLAVQDEPHREVALKVMRRHVASPSALRRFQLESHVLGHLRHPNVAQVYEAGMAKVAVAQASSPVSLVAVAQASPPVCPVEDDWATSVPYFAMEYITGAKTITRYADEVGLDLRERLGLFAKVCDAVHHGHQKGVIHRDLKPGNILVDSAGEPKVIDFGVARATDSDLAVTTMQTDAGELIGTLQYMSPEQCDPGATDIDTRSDVYSLGVVLYELLCGKPPYDVSDTTIVRAARVIAEQAPVPPSSLDAKLRGDVETVLLKALAKDREHRYQSAGEFAADIRRFLNREPIAARTPSAWRGMTHWIARRPIAATTTTCAVIVALSVLTTFLTVSWVNERPYNIKLQKNEELSYLPTGYAARLIARSGSILKEWPNDASKSNSSVGIARLVERPAELGGGRVAVIGFRESSGSPHSGALVAFDVDGDLDKPLWSRRIITDDLLPELLDHRQYTGDDFGFTHGQVADVFPERPGPEIVAVFGHNRSSQRILRIYDLAGELLYQVWHDGALMPGPWLSRVGLLVLAGDYHRPFWTPQGELKGPRARMHVVFALRPKVGSFGTDFLEPIAGGAGSDPLSPAWFNVLEPLDSADRLLHGLTALALKSPLSSPSRVVIDGAFGDAKHSVSWVLDDLGRTLPGWPQATDTYHQNQQLPSGDPNKLDLPPLRELRFVPFDESKHASPGANKPPATQKSKP